MSYCEVIEFKDGLPGETHEFQNAWGGSAFIWTCLYDKYLKDPSSEYDSWLSGGSGKLWDLAKMQDLPRHERAVLAATFDQAIIARENFNQFADDLAAFVDAFPAEDKVCHLTAWSHVFKAAECEAIGFYGTSVADNLWQRWNEDDEEKLYDLKTGTAHFEVYEYLAEHDKAKDANPTEG